jgi:hypothetical protein
MSNKIKPMTIGCNHSIPEMLKEMKFGRPAKIQKLIDKWIDEINQLTTFP